MPETFGDKFFKQLGSGLAWVTLMPITIWTFNIWISFMVERRWIDISWLKSVMQCGP